ncbi:late competence development ComFB family protein [Aneurinibacillus uraniidurans]|uniref:late competence development ComFB family protein n=1 Tax=Aneurinibacillus uraniidurans TaxID=2966586 RepID=UPI0023492FFC|nr:late competence development ComFB family protein [Aneurinibacillus sp. B1]WCN37401.1 late competence development ComFB family protein [Aneurinibacillus sp. B1]
MKVVNVMEELVLQILEEQWGHIEMPCKCDICKGDVYALTLNSLPPRYASKDLGLAFIKAEFFNKQSLANILCEITRATTLVAKHPSPHKMPLGS